MKRRTRLIRIMAACAALFVLCSIFPVEAVTEQLTSEWFQLGVSLQAVEPAEIVQSGTWGSGANSGTWTLDDQGKLTISGSGTINENYWDSIKGEIKELVVEEGITQFRVHNLFSGCTQLTRISLPSTFADTAGWGSFFSGCIALTEVDLSNTSMKAVCSSMFNGCTSLKSVKLPSTLERINSCAFQNCDSLEEVDFSNCTSLTDFSGWGVFADCDNLKKVVMPSSLANMNTLTFRNCTSLQSIDLSNTNVTELKEGMFSGCSHLSNVKFSENLSIIGKQAFRTCSDLDFDLSVYKNIQSIGESAFFGANSMSQINLSGIKNLTNIDSSAFTDDRLLHQTYTLVDLSNCGDSSKNITFAIGNYAFSSSDGYGVQTLKTVNLANSAVKSIGKNAFANATNLETVDLTNCKVLTDINESAFSNCTNLFEVDLSNCTSLTTIAKDAFKNCTSLSLLDLSDCKELTTIGANAFENCAIETLTIPEGVTSIAEGALAGCKDIVVLEWNAKNYTSPIASGTFPFAQSGDTATASQNTNRFDLKIGSSVQSLPQNFFYYLNNAGDIYFDGGSNGHTLKINMSDTDKSRAPEPLRYIENGDCFVDKYGVLYELFENDGQKTARIVYAPPELSNYEVPEYINGDYKVTEVGKSAFTRAIDLASITFKAPVNITSIDERAFYGLNTLTSVNGNNTVSGARRSFGTDTSIATSAFQFTGLVDTPDSKAPGIKQTEQEYVFDTGSTGPTTVTVDILPSSYEHLGKDPVTGENKETEKDDYHFLTGETLSIQMKAESANTANNGATVRVYFEFTQPDYDVFKLQLKPTTDANVYYYEFDINAGDTDTESINWTYPSPSSDGGAVKIWAEVFDNPLTLDEKAITPTAGRATTVTTVDENGNEETKEILRAPTAVSGKYISADWITSRRERKLSKSGMPQIVSILGNSEQTDKNLYSLAVSAWDITMAYDDNGRENSSNGSDYVRSATFTDTLKLPQGIRWDPDIVRALEAGSDINLTTRTSKADSRIQKDIYLGSRKVLYLSFPDTDTLTDVSLSLDGSDIIISWTLKEMTQTKELSNLPVKLGVFEGTLVMDLSQTYIADESTGDYKIALNSSGGRSASEDDFPLRFEESIENDVDVDMYYTHSLANHLQASDTISAEASRANLTFNKVRNSAEYTRLGDSDLRYTLTVENTGTQATYGLEYIEDYFSKSSNGTVSYYSPANMERMFQETKKLDDDITLSFIIENATLYNWTSEGETNQETVSGASASLDQYNSGTRTSKGTGTITITKTGEGYQADYVGEGGPKTETGTDIGQILNKLGYYVTAGADYHARWDFSKKEKLQNSQSSTNELYRFDGGQKLELLVYASNKTTFELLTDDQPGSYGGPVDLDVRQTNNGAMQVWDKDASDTGYTAKPIITDTATYYASKEVSITKKGSAAGVVSDTDIGNTQYMRTPVMEYTATAGNTGNINFGTLPMTDTLTGSQALLAPVALQTEHSQFNGCPVITVMRDDVETRYYVLTEGTYSNVCLGEIRMNGSDTGTKCLADTISVGREETEIKSTDPEYMEGVSGKKISYTSVVRWNLDSLPSGSSRTIVYDAVGIAFTSENTALRIFTYDNIVYLNGLNGDRLFDRISKSGSLGSSYSMDKAIVETPGSGYDLFDTSKNDHAGETLDDDDYSRITARDNTVLYKLTLSYNPPQESMGIAFKGSEIYDALPWTYGTFSWEKGTKGDAGQEGNVAIEVATTGGAEVSANFATEDWVVRQDGDYQYIRWSDDARIELKGESELIIYVTLTYANSTEKSEGLNHWEKYCKAAKGDTLVNTFYVCNKPSSVTHDLVYENEAYLQKGVSYVYDLADTGDRQHYSNGDYAYVEYYTVIYNGGYSRLYLADLIDDLPRGFAFHSVNSGMNSYASSNGAKYTNATSVYSKDGRGVPAIVTDPSLGDGVSPVYKAANIRSSINDAGQLVFHFTGNRNSANFISFDEVVAEEQGEDKAWYLNRGEAIAFTYTMKVDKTYGNTDDFARNQIHMNFNDPFGAGISRYEFTEGGGVTSARSGGVPTNDGSCYDYDGNRGLMSWVELERGEIIPGIKKDVVSYTSGNRTIPISSGNTAENPSSILWEISEKNQGSQEINAYVLTDTMDLPFQPMGKVSYIVYDSNNKERAAAYSNTSTAAPYLFEITHISDTAVTVLDLKGKEHTINFTIVNSAGQTTQTGTSEPITMPFVKYTYGNSGSEFKENESFMLSFTKVYSDATNTHGAVSMNLSFAEGVMSIMPAGYGTLRVSTSPIGSYGSGRYVNRADFNPAREYMTAGDGLNMADYVRDSANITVNGSGNTSSVKRVMENQHTKNEGNSDPQQNETNTITLADASNDFIYTLEVTNTTGQDMTKLVLVDNLPEKGDHYTLQPGTTRQSAFKVVLADDPGFVVYIDGEPVTGSGYSVQYSTKTTFTEADLQGESSSDWTNDPTGARSIRVIIDTLVPNTKKAKVTFKAKVDGERKTELSEGVYLLTDTAWILANQGKVAYNSFAYWYKVPSFDLSAGTELVGVRLPVFPKLAKQVLNRADEEVKNDDGVFNFVIYQGEKKDSLPDDAKDFTVGNASAGAEVVDGADTGALIPVGTPRLVTVDNVKYLQIRIKADAVSKDLYLHEFWHSGEKYTIEEVLDEGTSGYEKLNWTAAGTSGADNGTAAYYTFTWQSDTLKTFTARNRKTDWELTIFKVDADNNMAALKDVWFGLYGRRQPTEEPITFDDQPTVLKDAAYKVEGLAVSAPATYVDTNNVTWYFLGAKKTGEDGKAIWTGLKETMYRYLELEPPLGYKHQKDNYKTVGAISGGTVGASVTETVTNEQIKPIEVEISAKKTLHGRPMQAGEFSFQMRPILKDGTRFGETDTVYNSAADAGETVTITFQNLKYTFATYADAIYRDLDGNAVFYYVVQEEQGSKGGVAYDDAQFIVKVVVSITEKDEFATDVSYYRYGGSGALPADALADLREPA